MTNLSDEGLRAKANKLVFMWEKPICGQTTREDLIESIASALKQVRRETREECARVAESDCHYGREIATAIRKME